ncbi:MAG TPA: CapA family protein [Proteobacteria bacterium]|nr:CapA family protein [Pseudomonadota bacterium]
MKRFFVAVALMATVIAAVFVPHAFAREGHTVKIALLGDFLPASSAVPFLERKGTAYFFDGVRPILGNSDAVFLNLETPVSVRGTPWEGKRYTFRASPVVAKAMYAEGVRVVSLANNHILDYGYQALDDTMRALRAAGVLYVGAGMDANEASVPALVSTPSGEVAFLAFSNTLPRDFWAGAHRAGTLFGSPKTVKRLVTAAASKGAGSSVIVSFHWGKELMIEPKEYQTSLAHLAIDSGASLVVGHHPHVAQPIEIYRGRPVLYSLGNFAFGSYSKSVQAGLLVVAKMDEDGWCDRLEIYPLAVDNTEVLFRPRRIMGPEGKRIFEALTETIPRTEADVTWKDGMGVIIPRRPTGSGK